MVSYLGECLGIKVVSYLGECLGIKVVSYLGGWCFCVLVSSVFVYWWP